MRKYLQNFTGLDLFGHNIGVNYEDSPTYNTYLSAAFSLVSIILIVMNLSLLSLAFENGDKLEFKTTFKQVDRFDSPAYNLRDNGIEIALITESDEVEEYLRTVMSLNFYQYDRCTDDKMADCDEKSRKRLIGAATECSEEEA